MKKIQADMYGPGTERVERINTRSAVSPVSDAWTKITLTSCGLVGAQGPTIGKCIKRYNTDWSRNKNLFNVDANRPGIQLLILPRTGFYQLTGTGAGNVPKTGKGKVFIYS